MRRLELSLFAGLILALLITPLTGFVRDSEQVRQGVVRLHILANSDSAGDQQLKLAVRDKLLAETDGLFLKAHDGEEALEAARNNLDMIAALAGGEIARQGYDYGVEAQVTRLYFTTRVYDDFMLPAGEYDAVQLLIGEGKGKNWWCVMYPPMCLPAAQPPEQKEEEIRSLNARPSYKMGFALVELVERAAQYFEQEQDEPVESAQVVQADSEDAIKTS